MLKSTTDRFGGAHAVFTVAKRPSGGGSGSGKQRASSSQHSKNSPGSAELIVSPRARKGKNGRPLSARGTRSPGMTRNASPVEAGRRSPGLRSPVLDVPQTELDVLKNAVAETRERLLIAQSETDKLKKLCKSYEDKIQLLMEREEQTSLRDAVRRESQGSSVKPVATLLSEDAKSPKKKGPTGGKRVLAASRSSPGAGGEESVTTRVANECADPPAGTRSIGFENPTLLVDQRLLNVGNLQLMGSAVEMKQPELLFNNNAYKVAATQFRSLVGKSPGVQRIAAPAIRTVVPGFAYRHDGSCKMQGAKREGKSTSPKVGK